MNLLFLFRMKRLLLFLTAAMLLASCQHTSRPESVLTPLQMADFLTEAYLIESYTTIINPIRIDSIPDDIFAAYSDLLQRQGVTQEEVEKSLDYYGHNPDQYEKILNEVLYRLEDEGHLQMK